jgi:hypothetical protein
MQEKRRREAQIYGFPNTLGSQFDNDVVCEFPLISDVWECI